MNVIIAIVKEDLDPSAVAAELTTIAGDVSTGSYLVLAVALGLAAIFWGVPALVRFFKRTAR